MPQQTPPSAQPPVTNQPHILIPAEPLKIMQWVFTIRRHVELIPRSAIAIQQDPHMIEQLSRNITRTGLTMQTFNYLKLCSIVESMQELMVKNKMTGAPPKECLRQAVVQRMHQMQHRIPGKPYSTEFPIFLCPGSITKKNKFFFVEFSPGQAHLAWTKFCFWSGQKKTKFFLAIGPGSKFENLCLLWQLFYLFNLNNMIS